MEKRAYTLKQTISEKDSTKIEKMRFCIISNFKSQACRDNLLLFTLDNTI